MENVGASQARAELSALLERAFRGETIVITKRGRPIALLMPPEQAAARFTVEEAIDGLREFRKTHSLGGISIKELIGEGRKY